MVTLPYSQTFDTAAATWPTPWDAKARNGATTAQATVAGGRGVLAIPSGGYPELGVGIAPADLSMLNGHLRVDTVHTDASEQYDRLLVRAQGNWPDPIPATCYAVEWSPSGGSWALKLLRWSATVGVTLVNTLGSGVATSVLALSHRIDVTDDAQGRPVVRYRIWQTGQAEPSTWQLTHTDVDAAAVKTAGGVGVVAIGGNNGVTGKAVQVDNVTVTTTDTQAPPAQTVTGNLLLNPGAEVDTANTSATGGTRERITSPVHAGAGAFRLTCVGGGNANLLHTSRTTAHGLVPGQPVQVSVQSRPVTTPRIVTLLVDWYGPSGYVSTSGASGGTNVAGMWTPVQGALTMPANATEGQMYGQVQGAAANEQHDLDSFVMTVGNTPTTPTDGNADESTRVGGALLSTRVHSRIGGVLVPPWPA